MILSCSKNHKQSSPVYPWRSVIIYLVIRLAAPSLELSPPKPIVNGSAGEMAGIMQEVQVKHTKGTMIRMYRKARFLMESLALVRATPGMIAPSNDPRKAIPPD